jgi:cytochrome c oxidase assembly protein subunit 15
MNTVQITTIHDNPFARKQIGVWLMAGYLMVFIMLVLGGITRLTQSGLSIVEWNVIMGVIPPLNENEWNTAFEKYQQFPEYNILNKTMTVDEFKNIFWWEYIHRLWGRLIGIVFIIPFSVFVIQRKLNISWIRKLTFVFLLGAFQGFMGWYMVQSGLIENPHVSHYRLTMHLFLAFSICGLLLTYSMQWLSDTKNETEVDRSLCKFLNYLAVIVLIQSMLGGLVAGLKAGYVYNTYPKMGEEWLPNTAWMLDPAWLNFFENGVMIQFLHRTFALFVVISFLVFWFKAKRAKLPAGLTSKVHFLAGMSLVQLTLGVTTLLLAVPVFWGAVHQSGALVLFSMTLWVKRSFYN